MVFVVSALVRSLGPAGAVWTLPISTNAAQPSVTGRAKVGVVLIAVEQAAAAADLAQTLHEPNLAPLDHTGVGYSPLG